MVSADCVCDLPIIFHNLCKISGGECHYIYKEEGLHSSGPSCVHARTRGSGMSFRIVAAVD